MHSDTIGKKIDGTNLPAKVSEKPEIAPARFCNEAENAEIDERGGESAISAVPEIERRIKAYKDAYAAGQPLYRRDVLEDFERQFALNKGIRATYSHEDWAVGRRKYDPFEYDHRLTLENRAALIYSGYHALVTPQRSFDTVSNGKVVEVEPTSCLMWYPVTVAYELRLRKAKVRRSVSEMETLFAQYSEQWNSSETRQLFVQTLEQLLRRPEGGGLAFKNVDKIVCVGLGPLSCDMTEGHTGTTTRAYSQHAMALTLRQMICEHQHEHPKPTSACTISILAQDPAYAGTDADLLSSRAVKVVQDPTGFLAIDHKTIVIQFCLALPIYEILADDPSRWPAAITGTPVIEPKPPSSRVDDESDAAEIMRRSYYCAPAPRVLKMLAEYERHNVKDKTGRFGSDMGDWFGVYVRREDSTSSD